MIKKTWSMTSIICRNITIFSITIFSITFTACKKESESTIDASISTALNLPSQPYNYSNIQLPAHLLNNVLIGGGQNAAINNDNTPPNNPTTDHGATLGRVLFYDKNLSINRTIACASCHVQKKGFSDDAKLSKGFNDGQTRRHSMSLTNARFYRRGRFFWDERATTLEAQVLMPFQDAVEMGMTLPEIVNRVNEQSFYKQLFTNAFGNSEVNSDKISKALAQFIRSLVSVNSKYDVGRTMASVPTQDFSNFTVSENNGKRLFFQPIGMGGVGCIGCHSTEAFINPDRGATNNGIDAVSTTDRGVFEAIPQPIFLGTFKVPSLKNIAMTAPYMHDGRFTTLPEVIEHYNSGVQNHINLFPALRDRDGNPIRLNMTQTQKNDLLAFLNTLTDNEMLTDVKFSDPFKR